VLVELGSLWGKSALYLAELAKAANKDLEVWAIDNFSQPFAPDSMEGQEQARHGSLFETFAHYVSHSGVCPDPLRVIYMQNSIECQIAPFRGRERTTFPSALSATRRLVGVLRLNAR
jgi:hypothetical protein